MKKTRISYLEKGSYTELAALSKQDKIKEETGNRVELVSHPSIDSVMRSVSSNKSDYGIVAYYNRIGGLVQECLDLIYKYNLRIVDMQRLAIELAIGCHKDNNDYSRIYSHPKAFMQCGTYLGKMFKKARRIETKSTPEGIAIARKTKKGLAIGRKDSMESMKIIEENIEDKDQKNCTDFFTVQKDGCYSFENKKHYLAMLAVTPHFDRIGLLQDILGQAAWHRFNAVKIHSRPALDKLNLGENGEPQMFYLELDCGKMENRLERLVKTLQWGLNPDNNNIETVRVLGYYEKPT